MPGTIGYKSILVTKPLDTGDLDARLNALVREGYKVDWVHDCGPDTVLFLLYRKERLA